MFWRWTGSLSEKIGFGGSIVRPSATLPKSKAIRSSVINTQDNKKYKVSHRIGMTPFTALHSLNAWPSTSSLLKVTFMKRGRKTKYTRTASPARRWASALMVVLLLTLSFASVSPILHDWLNAGNSCESVCSSESHGSTEDQTVHVCAVEIFGMGADCPSSIEIPSAALIEVAQLSSYYNSTWDEKSVRSRCARAPPIESVVTA